jgi:hypothetical protein
MSIIHPGVIILQDRYDSSGNLQVSCDEAVHDFLNEDYSDEKVTVLDSIHYSTCYNPERRRIEHFALVVYHSRQT